MSHCGVCLEEEVLILVARALLFFIDESLEGDKPNAEDGFLGEGRGYNWAVQKMNTTLKASNLKGKIYYDSLHQNTSFEAKPTSQGSQLLP